MSFKMVTVLLFVACWSAVKATTTIMIAPTTAAVSEMQTSTSTTSTASFAATTSEAATSTTSVAATTSGTATSTTSVAATTSGTATPSSSATAAGQFSTGAASASATASATAAVTPTPSASSSATASAGASCVPMNSTQCDPKVCCKGSAAAWSGVDSSKNLNYNETVCTGGLEAYVPRQKSCVDACVKKECDGGASGLIVQSTTVLLSLLACWILTSS